MIPRSLGMVLVFLSEYWAAIIGVGGFTQQYRVSYSFDIIIS